MDRKPRIVTPDKVEEKTFLDKLSDFIGKHKVVFIAAFSVVVGGLAIVGIVSLAANAVGDASARAMEQARAKIATYSAESDATKKAELEKALFADLGSVAKKWPRSFAAQEALYAQASLYASKKDWANSEKQALEAAAKLPKTYLAPLALEMAAIAQEEQAKPDAALDSYSKIVDQYKTDAPNIAHAYFSLGRLKEGRSDWKGALESYDKLVASFPDSSWSKLAKDRQIFIKARGYDKK